MQVVKMIIAYDGSQFFGWQRQNKHRNVQGEIEKALKKILKQVIEIDGAGRTDAGVHALGQVATFGAVVPMPLDNLKRALNNELPIDIVVKALSFESNDFHARYSAIGKTYVYKVDNSPLRDVFKSGMYHYPYDLDLELMKAVAEKLVGYHNFEAFKASGSSAGNPFRTIHSIEIKKEDNQITMTFSGDGFLYKMVRLLVAFILGVGNKRIPLDVVDEILKNPSREFTSKVAPARGLYLREVFYN
jgi:tRNA pseudouridine38-40 synthase